MPMTLDPSDEAIQSIVRKCARIAMESPTPFTQVGDFLNQLEREVSWTHDEFMNLRRAVIRQFYGNYLVEAYRG